MNKINKGPLKIQSKTQISIGLAMLIGFTAVTIIAFFVLNKVSKESLVSTINISVNDIESNLVSDADSDFIVEMQAILKLMKQSSLQKEVTEEQALDWGYESLEQYEDRQLQNLKTIVNGRQVSDLVLIRKNGTIKYSSNEYISSLSNISELNIKQHNPDDATHTCLEYQYISQLDENYKCLFYNYYTSSSDFYVLGMLDEEMYNKQLKKSIEKGIASRHIGEYGYVVVADDSKNVISSATDLIVDTIDINLTNLNNVSLYELDNNKYYSYVSKFEDYYIIGFMNQSEWDSSMQIALLTTAITEIVVFFILYFMIYFSISNSVIKPLKRVNLSLDRISKGSLEERVNENSSIELQSLSSDINQTVDSLKEYMGKEAKMIQKELNFAKEIQHSVLPLKFPPFPEYSEFDIYACMETAKEVGGDFYDFYLVDERHLCILIADVSGKGVPAALFMMQAKTIIKNFVEKKIPLNDALIAANNQLNENNVAEMFVTVWCGILDLDTGKLQFVNAGHNPPVLIHNGKGEFLKSKINLVLAGMDNIKYDINEVILAKGDELLLYTDGVTEATSSSNELWGNDNLIDVIDNSKHNSSKELCFEIMNQINEFTKETEQSDDITMVDIKYFGK